jgi:TonB family protein
MSTLHKLALPAVAALSLPSAPLVAPALAGPQAAPSHEIVVTAAPRQAALANWAHRIQANLESNMRLPRAVGGDLYSGDAMAEVSFVCGESGRPTQVALARPSGNTRIDGAALNAVRDMSSLQPLPEGMKADQKILAQLLFINSGDSPGAIDRHVKAMQKEAAGHNQWFYRDEIASGETILLAAAR